MQEGKENRLKSLRRVEPVFNFEIDLSDVAFNFEGLSASTPLFLGRFSEQNVRNVMERIGLISHLDSMGFSVLHIDIDRDENNISYLKLYWKDDNPENQLLDLRISEHTFVPHERYLERGFKKEFYDMLLIEWLSAKNPLAKFKDNRPQLPGQSKPGLGILKYCFQLLYEVSNEIFKDGFLDIPTHMHGAMMYSQKFKFYDPVQEAILRAAMRDLSDYSLADISWGIITESIIDLHKDTVAEYNPGEQIHYVSNRMRRHFESWEYLSTFRKFYVRKKYYFDYEQMLSKREEILLTKKIEDL